MVREEGEGSMEEMVKKNKAKEEDKDKEKEDEVKKMITTKLMIKIGMKKMMTTK